MLLWQCYLKSLSSYHVPTFESGSGCVSSGICLQGPAGDQGVADRVSPPAAAQDATTSPGDRDTVAAEMLGSDEASPETSTLFVKNLAFATTDEALRAHFAAAISARGGALRSARVSKKRGPGGKLQSAGFGFVECSSDMTASAVLKGLQVCRRAWDPVADANFVLCAGS